jgi:hypothetical protein
LRPVHVQRGRTSLIVGISLVVGGLALGGLSAFQVVRPFVDLFTAPALAVPGEHRISLSSGTHVIFQRAGISSDALTVDERIDLDAITVTSVDGRELTVRQPGTLTETLARDSTTYIGVARFDVPSAGEYTVRISGSRNTEIIVTRSLGATARSVLGWLAAGLAAGAAIVAGIIVIIVGWLAHRRATRAAEQSRLPVYAAQPHPSQYPETGQTAPSWQPAPGWYPDPEHPHTFRYWDGNAWTAHTHEPDET